MGDAFGPVDAVRAFLAKRFDRVVAISQYMAGVMRRHGVPEGRLETINLGVDPERLRSLARRPTPEVRRELGVAPGQLLAVMVGNIRPWKGQAVVLRALHLLDPSARSQLRVAFAGAVGAGDEGYAGALRESVREWGLDACVTFLGRRADVPDLLNAADLAIHASLIPEPAGLVVLEAMALGAPVIAANRGGPQEYLSDGAGCTFDSEKPAELAAFLSELLRSDERRHELARKARVRVEQYTVAQNVRGVQALYDRLLGTS
jgi:glycosyltransferase involved in cell wall biosynthesis